MAYGLWRMAGVRNALLIAAILAAPWIAEAAAPENWRALVIYLVKLMNSGIATLILLAFVVYFYGIASNILRFDESGYGFVKSQYIACYTVKINDKSQKYQCGNAAVHQLHQINHQCPPIFRCRRLCYPRCGKYRGYKQCISHTRHTP